MALRLEGVKDLDAALKQMATSTAKRTARRAMATVLEPVAAAARGMAPVATGRLVGTIGVGPKLTRRQARLSRKAIGKDELVMHVGATGRVAHLIEFGTTDRQHKSGKGTGSVRPMPFLRPAWDANRMGVFLGLADEMRAEILKTVARAEKAAARKAAKAAR